MKVRGILGKKIGMTQIFNEHGQVVPVTVIQAGPCRILQAKSETGKDRYAAVKLGFETIEERKVRKPQLGEFKKLEAEPMRYIREIRVPEDQLGDWEVGSDVDVSIFEPGDYVNISGKSKGRGFAGVMKRHGFGGAKASHGVHEFFRHGGAVGCSAWPGKIFKGKKMPGQYGNVPYTAENVIVIGVDTEKNLLLVRGAVPGSRNSFLKIRNAKKKWKRA